MQITRNGVEKVPDTHLIEPTNGLVCVNPGSARG